MLNRKPYRHLNVQLAKAAYWNRDFHAFLTADASITHLKVEEQHNFDGVLYIKNPKEKRPPWAQLIDAIAGKEIGELSNKSSSAVMLIRVDGITKN
jgi:uncharacterized protein (TIGR04141 family)